MKATDNAKGERPIYLKYFVQGKYVKRSTDIWGMGGENLNYGDKDEIPYTEMR